MTNLEPKHHNLSKDICYNSESILEERLHLVYTWRRRDTRSILADQSLAIKLDANVTALQTELTEMTSDSVRCLRNGKYDERY